MTPEQQRKILEAAAKACGYRMHHFGNEASYVSDDLSGGNMYWNPVTDSADTVRMCAKLDINTYWWPEYVDCTTQNISCDIPHNGTPEGKESAWRLAASIVAAKIGGYEE